MKKKLIILVTILLIMIIGFVTYFAITQSNKNKYQNATEYAIKGEKVPSVKSVLGDKKVIKCYHEDGDVETLTLTFEDSDGERSATEYIDHLLKNESYLKMRAEDESIKEAAKNMESQSGILTVDAQAVDKGFKVTIKAGAGTISVDPME